MIALAILANAMPFDCVAVNDRSEASLLRAASHRRCEIRGCFRGGIPPFMFISPSDTEIILRVWLGGVRGCLTSTNFYMSYLALLGSPFAAMGLTVKGLKNFFRRHQIYSQDLNVNNSQDYSGDYGDLRAADPYSNYDYHMGFGESFLRALGFRTKYDAYKESMAIQSKEYQAGIDEKQYNEAFDSPAAQAQRMREAGQNPDLVGTSGVEASSPLRDDGNPLGAVPAEDVSSAPGLFANFILSGITAAYGIAQNAQSLKSLQLANENSEIGNSANILDFAIDAISSNVTFPTSEELATKSPEGYRNIMDSLLNDSYQTLASKYRGVMSKKTYKKFMAAVEDLWSSAPVQADAYKSWVSRIESRKKVFSDVSSDRYSDTDDVLYLISKELNKFNDEAYHILNRNQVKEAELRTEQVQNQIEYESGLNPSADALLHNESTSVGSQNAEIEKAMNDTLNRIVTSLEKKANSDDKGSNWAAAALLVFSVMRTMSFSQSSRTSYDLQGNPTTSQSTSVGF